MRLHFTSADLARTRVSDGLSPEVELIFSLRMLREPPILCFGEWRTAVGGRIDPRAGRLLAEVADGAPLGGAGRVVAAYERFAIDPFQHRMEVLISADRVRRARTVADGGLDLLLSTLHPDVRWQDQVLTVTQPGAGVGEAELDGRGLLLQPSVFVWRGPVFRRAADGRPILVYPVSCEISGQGEVEDIGALIGRTRALLMSLLVERGATATELAGATGLSLAAISQHATVLRAAGLVTTQRLGRSRLHSLTPIGERLMRRPTQCVPPVGLSDGAA